MGSGAGRFPQRLVGYLWRLCHPAKSNIGFVPIRTITAVGSLIANTHGESSPRTLQNCSPCGLASASAWMVLISILLNASFNATAAALTVSAAVELTTTKLPPAEEAPVLHLAHVVYPGDSAIHPALGLLAALTPRTFSRYCSNCSGSACNVYEHLTTVTRCPANGFRAAMNLSLLRSNNFTRGPWMRTNSSICCNCAAAISSRCCISPASFFTATNSSCAFWANLAASPACLLSNVCIASVAASNLTSYFHSPATPTATMTSPRNATIFTHVGVRLSGSAPTIVPDTGNSSLSAFRSARSFLRRSNCLVTSMTSWITATPSTTTPITTSLVDHTRRANHFAASSVKARLAASWAEKSIQEQADDFSRFLFHTVVVAAIIHAFCIWEFTIGLAMHCAFAIRNSRVILACLWKEPSPKLHRATGKPAGFLRPNPLAASQTCAPARRRRRWAQ